MFFEDPLFNLLTIVAIAFAVIIAVICWATTESIEKCTQCGADTRGRVDEVSVCEDCETSYLNKLEGVRLCPIDQAKMVKHKIEGDIVIDCCPTCQGVWLDADELESLKSVARSSGQTTGFIIGSVVL